MQSESGSISTGSEPTAEVRLSYKFQRLRERLRESIRTGELSGKLPGERLLARKFRVNAKTLSKALTDLAAEGLLQRSIGRGTYVRGSESNEPEVAERWLMIADADHAYDGVIEALRGFNADLQVAQSTSDIRPSALGTIRTVVIFEPSAPREFVHDLLVRGISVIVVGHEPAVYSTHAVLIDRLLAASYLGRDVALLGHRSIGVIDEGHATAAGFVDVVAEAVRRCAADAKVHSLTETTAIEAISSGTTAIICSNAKSAIRIRDFLMQRGIEVPGKVSIGGVGCGSDPQRCTGYYCSLVEKAQAINDVIRSAALQRRPTIVWLSGTFYDAGTIAPPTR